MARIRMTTLLCALLALAAGCGRKGSGVVAGGNLPDKPVDVVKEYLKTLEAQQDFFVGAAGDQVPFLSPAARDDVGVARRRMKRVTFEVKEHETKEATATVDVIRTRKLLRKDARGKTTSIDRRRVVLTKYKRGWLVVEMKNPCRSCKGTGLCWRCDGSGKVDDQKCPSCQGANENKCTRCRGKAFP